LDDQNWGHFPKLDLSVNLGMGAAWGFELDVALMRRGELFDEPIDADVLFCLIVEV
jgi:hypothetical protein